MTNDELTTIRRQYPTIEQLWAELTPNFDAGVQAVARQLSLDAVRLRVLLVGNQRGRSAIQTLEGISDSDAAMLRRHGIRTVDALWARVGEKDEESLQNVADAIGMDCQQLQLLLIARGRHEANGQDATFSQRLSHTLGRNWLVLIAMFGVVVYVLLGLRALGWLNWLPTPIGVPETVVIAARPLAAGDVLQVTDIYTVSLTPGTDQITSTAGLVGSVVQQPIARGQPLRRSALQRLQVVAIQDINADTILSTSAISISQSPYLFDAATSLDKVRGAQALQAIHKGTVITSRQISAIAPVTRVVVRASDGLPAYHLITAEELVTEQGMVVSGAYTDMAQVVGRYTLRPLARGSVVGTDDVRAVLGSTGTLSERRVITVPVQDQAALSSVTLGGPVSFLLQPRQAAAGEQVVEVRDAIVLDVLHRNTAPALVVALLPADFTNVRPLLGRSDAVVYHTVLPP